MIGLRLDWSHLPNKVRMILPEKCNSIMLSLCHRIRSNLDSIVHYHCNKMNEFQTENFLSLVLITLYKFLRWQRGMQVTESTSASLLHINLRIRVVPEDQDTP